MERVFSPSRVPAKNLFSIPSVSLQRRPDGGQKHPERPPGVQSGLRLIRNPDYSCLSWSSLTTGPRRRITPPIAHFFSAALTISPSLDPSYEFRRRTGRGGVSISVFPDVISLLISK